MEDCIGLPSVGTDYELHDAALMSTKKVFPIGTKISYSCHPGKRFVRDPEAKIAEVSCAPGSGDSPGTWDEAGLNVLGGCIDETGTEEHC